MKQQPKVLLSTGSLYHMGIDHIYEIAEKAGFAFLELMLRGKEENGWWDTWNHNYLKKLEKTHQIKIDSLHSPIDFEQNAAGYIDDTVSLAQALGVNHIIFHIPKNKESQENYREWFGRNYKKYLQESPIRFLTENMGPKCIEQGTEAYNKYPDFCFDIAHELSNGSDVMKMVSGMPSIRQFHVSWFDGKTCHMGIMEQKAFFAELLSLHPNAYRTLELCPKAFNDLKEDDSIINTLKKTRLFLESL